MIVGGGIMLGLALVIPEEVILLSTGILLYIS
jgi:hypothetical protein